jgi:hypothetical protein
MFRVSIKILRANSIIRLVTREPTVKMRTYNANTFNHDTRYIPGYQTLLPAYILRFFVNNNALQLQSFDHCTKRKRHITQTDTRINDTTNTSFT